MNLLIDIGNSRIKFAPNELPFETTAITHNDIQNLLNIMIEKKITRITIACGRSKSSSDVLSVLQNFASRHNIYYQIASFCSNLLTINYSDPSQFGTDRFLNLIAAKIRYENNFCVVSCGTAITLDFYTDTHIGGMILPGLMSSQKLLSQKTGLHNITYPSSLLGNDTATCIGAGIYIGLQNLIYSSIERVEKQKDTKFNIILTGGDAKTLYQTGTVIESLLFEGMSHYINQLPINKPHTHRT